MLDKIQYEAAERLARIEEIAKYLRERADEDLIDRRADMQRIDARLGDLETFKDAMNRKIAYIGGVLVTIGMVIPYAINWIASHISWRSM